MLVGYVYEFGMSDSMVFNGGLSAICILVIYKYNFAHWSAWTHVIMSFFTPVLNNSSVNSQHQSIHNSSINYLCTVPLLYIGTIFMQNYSVRDSRAREKFVESFVYNYTECESSTKSIYKEVDSK